jgi:methylglutaconyl-CoA hydratase
MRKYELIKVEPHNGIVQVTLNRPEVRNAFNSQMVVELRSVFQELGQDQNVRAIVIAGAGPIFCAGLDLRWVASSDGKNQAQWLQEAEHLTQMYQAIDECPCPVVGRVHGSAFGGGIGIVASCDVVVASEEAQFALREVRVGLVPAVIAPYLLRKLGFSWTSRYRLTGEPFSARIAQTMGLVHEVVPAEELDSHIQILSNQFLQVGPQAVRETKFLLRRLLTLPDQDRWSFCAQTNARIRGTSEAHEGLQAFVEKRLPTWVKESSQIGASG